MIPVNIMLVVLVHINVVLMNIVHDNSEDEV